MTIEPENGLGDAAAIRAADEGMSQITGSPDGNRAIVIRTWHDSGLIDEAYADDLGGAAQAVQTLCTDTGHPVQSITITLLPGWCLVGGQPHYSSAWL